MAPRPSVTRILGRAWATRPGVYSRLTTRAAWLHSGDSGRERGEAIPFLFDSPDGKMADSSKGPQKTSTITPSEAEVFRAIFDEIAHGRMTVKKPARQLGQAPASQTASESAGTNRMPNFDMTRVVHVRDRTSRQYPASLREAAEEALSVWKLGQSAPIKGRPEPSNEEVEKQKQEDRLLYEPERIKECRRITALMKRCETDGALWQVLEDEIFSLPSRLGFVPSTKKVRPSKKHEGQNGTDVQRPGEKAEEQTPESEDAKKRMIYVHGPLYPYFLSYGLFLLNKSFARPSQLAFRILPRVKELGPSSYVLGISTPLYGRIARMHWNCRGDAHAALDTLQEMIDAGLQADDYVAKFLAKLRTQVRLCVSGEQGPFVAGMVNTFRYDQVFMQRLEEMERSVADMLNESLAQDTTEA